MTLVRRLALVVLGLVSTAVGQGLFMLFSGANNHLAGALLGAAGGTIIGVRRRVHRVRWLATGGGVLFALVVVGMEYLSQGTCSASPSRAIGCGAFTGFGIGAIADGARRSARTPAAGLPPEHPRQDGAEAR